MREIKFRAWEKINRMWLKSFNVNLLNIDVLSNVEIMQYTGLKDIAGDEIYEGDIVKDISNESIGYIEYSDGGYVIVYDDIMEKLNSDESAYLEVIGNIYENSKLLGEG